jgi:hypothetical protein
MDDIFSSLIFLIIGIGFLVVYFIAKQKYKRLLENGIEVEGVINGFEQSGSLSDNSRFPIVRFQTKEGVLITEKADISLPPFLLKEGQKVTVVYNNLNPKEFNLKTTFDFSKFVYVIIIISVVFIAVGLYRVYKYMIGS